MNNHLVSIIIPVKNGANYLAEALRGIKAQNVDMEIIVVDDASDDETSQIAKNFGCIVIRHETNKGQVSSKNTALKIAKGKYIMFHDHDDVMNQNALSQSLKELQENEKIFAVTAQIKDFFSPELSEAERRKIALRSEAYFGIFSGAILIKKEVFDIIGLLDESVRAGEIIDWTSKMNQNNLLIKKLNFVSVNRRIHQSNFGRTYKEKEYKDYAAILRSKLKQEIGSEVFVN